jgi:serine/threonine protein kinase
MNSSFILNIYGISQDPNTKDYIMVLENVEGENLYDWVHKNYRNFNWSNKIRILFYIVQSLKEIHQEKMIHRDFNTGNMLISTNYINDFNITILDMKSCGEAGEIDETKVYGDTHYTAPEVLDGESYTQAANIYSFGMIMYFMVIGTYPSDEIKQEINELEAPKSYINLMKKCLDLNPDNRPNVDEIEELIKLFYYSYLDDTPDFKRIEKIDYEIKKQFEEAEKCRNAKLTEETEKRVKDTQFTVGNALDALVSYTSLIEIASDLIKTILDVYQAAEYNKNICRALADRVGITIGPLWLLRFRLENKLCDGAYYDAFYKFIYTLENIKVYVNDISKIHGFRKYSKAISVKQKFEKLTEEYDAAMKDLNFTLVIANEERRKNDLITLSEELAKFEEYLSTIDGKAENINEEVKYIWKHLGDKTFHDANKIDSKDLLLPARGKPDDKRGKYPYFVVRRILNGQEVACKFTSMTDEEMESNTRVQGHLEILMKLSECNHILGFYGVSKIDYINVMVFEWAQHGTLKELYEKKDIQWHYKVKIALKICRGLIFLHIAEILHHDLRCESILMTESLEPKIYNFKLARPTFGKTTTLKKETNDLIRWLAPEKLINYKARYTTQCEIFSFGVLLWELAFEKIPYGSLKSDEVRDFVTKGGRERIRFGDSAPEVSKLQEDYKKIIDDSKYYLSLAIK